MVGTSRLQAIKEEYPDRKKNALAGELEVCDAA
jgi:hypothetical protein